MPNYDMKYYERQRALLSAREEAAEALKRYQSRLQKAYGDPEEMEYWNHLIENARYRLSFIHQELLPSQ